MLKIFLVVTIIVTIIAFVVLLFLVGKLSIELGLFFEAEDIQNAIDNGDFLACFIDDLASAIEVMVIIGIVLEILVLL